MLAQPDRGRRRADRAHRQSQFRQSRAARDHGPVRQGDRGHSARPAARSPSRSSPGNVSLYNETNGQAILPTPAIGGVGLLPDLSVMATHRLQGGGRFDHPHRRPRHAYRPIDLSARDPRPRGWRPAAGRPRPRTPPWRFRPRSSSAPATSPPFTTFPMAAWPMALAEMALASGTLGAEIALCQPRAPYRAFRRGSGPLCGDLPAGQGHRRLVERPGTPASPPNRSARSRLPAD